MIEAINTVRGAVAKKDLVPILTHLHFYNGRVQGSNGKIVIDSPCPEVDIDITVPLEPFVKAIEQCCNEPELELLDNKVRIKSGRFKADIAVEDNSLYPVVKPDANPQDCDHFMDSLCLVSAFMGNDASRLWACGVNLANGFAYATNNVSLVKSAIAFKGAANIPANTVNELVRLGNQPTGIAYGTQTATFYYGNGVWLKTTLIALEWPDVERLLVVSPNLIPVPPEFYSDLKRVVPFTVKKTPTVKLCEDGIFVQGDNKEAEVTGYSFPLSYFRAEPLLNVMEVATKIDFGTYPKPCYFEGEGIVGVIIGCIP